MAQEMKTAVSTLRFAAEASRKSTHLLVSFDMPHPDMRWYIDDKGMFMPRFTSGQLDNFSRDTESTWHLWNGFYRWLFQ